MLTKNKVWIRATTEGGEAITTGTFRLQLYKASGEGYVVDDGNVIAFMHVGDGHYYAEVAESAFGRIEQYNNHGVWMAESEATDIIVPGVDLVSHLVGSGAKHSIDAIDGLSSSLSQINQDVAAAQAEINAVVAEINPDLSGVVPNITHSQNIYSVVVKCVLPVSAYGFWVVQYKYSETLPAVGFDWGGAEEIVAGQSSISIPKPPEGSDYYSNGSAYVSFRVKFVGLNSETAWSLRQSVTVPQSDLTIEALVESIKTNPTMMSELADLLASKVVIETFHAQQSSV